MNFKKRKKFIRKKKERKKPKRFKKYTSQCNQNYVSTRMIEEIENRTRTVICNLLRCSSPCMILYLCCSFLFYCVEKREKRKDNSILRRSFLRSTLYYISSGTSSYVVWHVYSSYNFFSTAAVIIVVIRGTGKRRKSFKHHTSQFSVIKHYLSRSILV